jgi:hypothetical protein
MMCHSAEDLREKSEWDGKNGESRRILLSELSSEPRLHACLNSNEKILAN